MVRTLWKYLAVGLFFIPTTAFAATYNYDLGIRPEDISFEPATFLVGDTVRIYATVRNFGRKDARANVLFLQGATPIGDAQRVSVRAIGFADEVFVDLVVPSRPFNVLVSLREPSPEDENSSNDQALSPIFTPVNDTDRDGIADEKDNCSIVANSNQKDTDGDGKGDLCDDDIDNDGLTNEQERKLGTDPYKPDTDGDGVIDSKDAYPLDPKRSAVTPAGSNTSNTTSTKSLPNTTSPSSASPPPAPVPTGSSGSKVPASGSSASTPSSKLDIRSGAALAPLLLKIPKSGSSTEITIPEPRKTDKNTLRVSVRVERKGWNRFAFFANAYGAKGAIIYTWEFGDGRGGIGQNLEHQFRRSGDYHVTLKVQDSTKQKTSDSVDISISFWNLHNSQLWILVGLMVLGSSLLLRFSSGKRPY